MKVTCQRCGANVSTTIATQFHPGWCVTCIDDLIAAEQEAVQIMIEMERDNHLSELLEDNCGK